MRQGSVIPHASKSKDKGPYAKTVQTAIKTGFKKVC